MQMTGIKRAWLVWRPDTETRDSAKTVRAENPQRAAEIGFMRLCAEDHDFSDAKVCVLGDTERKFWDVQATSSGGYATRAKRRASDDPC